MSKRGENIYKRKDGRWEGRYIRFYNERKQPKFGYIYGKSYSEVKNKLLEKKQTIQVVTTTHSKRMVLYNDILTDWLLSARLSIKESTYARYTHLINTHIRPQLGEFPLLYLTTQIVESFIRNQLDNGRLDGNGGLSAKTVTDILTIIKSTIEYARNRDFVVTCNLGKLTIKKKEKEMRVLTQSEQAKLIKVLVEEIDVCRFGVLLSLYTGIRIGELCALKWEDLCVPQSVLRIRKTMQRIQDSTGATPAKTKIIITEPKSQCSVRDIPLPDFLLSYAKLFFSQPKAYILSGAEDKYIEPRTMQNRFKTYVKESGIDDANFHALRHTFATRCVEVGFEIKSLSEILGHANVNITLNRYVHSSFDLKQANMNKLVLDI